MKSWRREGGRIVSCATRNVLEQLESRRLLAAVGPDGWGYVANPVPFQDVMLTAGQGGAVATSRIDLGKNTLNLYGHVYSGGDFINADAYGIIRLGTELRGTPYAINATMSRGFQRAIAPLWTTTFALNYAITSQFVSTRGDATPEWLTIQFYNAAKGVKFHAMLELNTGNNPGEIVFNYADVKYPDGSSALANATVGIKDAGNRSNRLQINLGQASNALIGNGKAIIITNTAQAAVPHANAGGFRAVNEGPAASYVLNGTASTDPNQSGKSLTYEWDLDLDGKYGEIGADATYGDERGPRPTFTTSTGLDGEKLWPVVLVVIDADGLASFDDGILRVRDVPTTIDRIEGPTTGIAGVPVSFTISASDAFPSDVRGVSVYWNDPDNPTTDSGNANDTHLATDTFSYVYNKPGTYELQFWAYQWAGNYTGPIKRTLTITSAQGVSLNNGTLLVNSGSGNDAITLDQSNGKARLNVNGSITTYALTSVKSFSVLSNGGDDRITCALNIPTSLLGGDGNDSIVTAGGKDTVLSEAGADTITTNDGDDSIWGGDGNDLVNVGNGNDWVDVADGDNTVRGGAGDDFLRTGLPEGGNDDFDGGTGVDTIYPGGGDNIVRIEAGLVTSFDGNDTIIGGDGGLKIEARGGDDSITTGSGNDSIDSGSGADWIASGDGADSVFANAGGGTYVASGAGPDTIWAWSGDILDGGGGDDTITAGYVARYVNGGTGDDEINAGINDGIAQSVYGGDGNDSIKTDGYFADGGEGNDVIQAAASDGAGVTVMGGAGDDDISTGDNRDTVYGEDGADTVHSGNASDLLVGGAGPDNLFGQGGADRIYGNGGSDRIDGGGGDDRIDGGTSRDTINGGDGSDAANRNDAEDILTSIERDLV